jgi:hypothetical protein
MDFAKSKAHSGTRMILILAHILRYENPGKIFHIILNRIEFCPYEMAVIRMIHKTRIEINHRSKFFFQDFVKEWVI